MSHHFDVALYSCLKEKSFMPCFRAVLPPAAAILCLFAGGQNAWADAAGRARTALAAMSRQGKLAVVMSLNAGGFPGDHGLPKGAYGSAAYLPMPATTGLPTLEISDAGLGVRNPNRVRGDAGDSVSLPSGPATAATWDPDMARAGGAMIGEEAYRQGFNILLAGGANLIRDPRGGRDFEYASEDPLLTGRMVGSTIAGVQSRHVMSTIKHFALNAIETARFTMSANLSPQDLRESDLLAFEIGIETGHPGAVMCGYNRVNQHYACENSYLLNAVLKHDWSYRGFVMSDWGATHSTVAAINAGLDQESSGDTMDAHPFFAAPLKDALDRGEVSGTRLDDMVLRVLTAAYSVGLADHPPRMQPMDVAADTLVAQKDEEAGAVLLRNEHDVLPLARTAHVVMIGAHADVGVISGGGSSQVSPIGHSPVPGRVVWPADPVWFPSAPLLGARAIAGAEHVSYDPGTDVGHAVAAARAADVAVVFVTQFSKEGVDLKSMELPDQQDALIAAVAKANPRTVVVLETSGPVLMPWIDQVSGVLSAWYPGSGGGTAIARLLYGQVNPAGRLPVTFPAAEAQLPRATIAGAGATSLLDLYFHLDQELSFREGADVGYRWFDRSHSKPLYPFGYGLSYTHFDRGGLHLVRDGQGLHARFQLRNTGTRPGAETAQLYVRVPGAQAKRLAGWSHVQLAVGESRAVDVLLEPRVLSHFDVARDRWVQSAGHYTVWLAADAEDETQPQEIVLPEVLRAP